MNKFRSRRSEDTTRINEMIRVPMVRVVSSDGEALGIIPIEDALERAQNSGYDLVEIAPNAEPPVCKIMDYGKFKYEKSKKEKESKKKQHVMHLKEIKFHPKTDTHDYEFKVNHAKKFLLKGDRVKITIVFRGREIVYKDFGAELLSKITNELSEIATVEQSGKMEGRNMVSTFVPDKVKVATYKRNLEKEDTNQ